MRNRLVALLLCAAMVLSLFGCTGDPAPTTPPTDPTEPPALSLYQAALPALEKASDVTLTISATTRTHVAAELLSKGSDQVLVFSGRGTDSPVISATDAVNYDGLNFVDYREVFTEGTLYLDATESNSGDTARFSTATTMEAAAARYLPVVLLDEALYGSVTMTETPDGTLITFAEPTAAESWAMPERAELVEAAGTALLDADGALKQYTYEISYKYGASKVIYSVTSDISLEESPVYAPTADVKYTAVADPDAIKLYYEGICYMAQADKITSNTMESTLCQAGGVMDNQSVALDLYITDTDVNAKLVTSSYIMAADFTEEYELEELFTDNKYTASTDGGEPEWNSSITPGLMYTYTHKKLYDATIVPSSWQDMTLTDMGSVWLLEYTLSTAEGWEISDRICGELFGDPDVLDDNCTRQGINEVGGYFALDKFTGLPTAAGYNLDAWHILDFEEYALTYQIDQSFDIPGMSAYHNITEDYLAESKPIDLAKPLFYHVTGDDGQEMWLLGTIHVGDNRTAYLPQEIYDAFAASDALALEYDSKAFDEQVEEDEALQDQIGEAYYYADGSTTADHLDAELYDAAVRYMKATGNYNMNAPLHEALPMEQFHREFLPAPGLQPPRRPGRGIPAGAARRGAGQGGPQRRIRSVPDPDDHRLFRRAPGADPGGHPGIRRHGILAGDR